MPVSKENEVLTAPPETATSTSSFGTETSNRPLPVALEVPVTVNGARAVEGTDKREPFSETTKTVLVFGNGAVIRLTSPVAAGQLLFLTNEKTKKEVVCQVVKSKNYKNVSGYVELEFTESVVGFWGMRFPTDRIGGQASASATATTLPPSASAKVTSLTPVPPAPKPANPVVSAAPKLPEVKPAPIQAELKPTGLPKPADAKPVAPATPSPVPPAIQTSIAPIVHALKQPDVPMTPPAPPVSSSLASSLATLLNVPETQPPSIAATPVAPPALMETKAQPEKAAVENSSEELKLQAARLQEQLSSLLFSAPPVSTTTAPVVPALDPKTVSNVAASVLEFAKSESAPAVIPNTAALSAKTTLDTEEVKIPSWLEPLARNAAASVVAQEPAERERAKHASEDSPREELPLQLLPVAAEESFPESQLPAFGTLTPLDEPVITPTQSAARSGKGLLFATIAASVLVGLAGAWYLFRSMGSDSDRRPTPSVASAALPQSSAVSTPSTAVQLAPQNTATASLTTPSANLTAPTVNTPPVTAPSTKHLANPEPAPVTKDNTRVGTTIPASATERISRPEPEAEPKKSSLGEVHLASPTLNRPANSQDDGVVAPAITSGGSDTDANGLGSGLPTNALKQPSAPEVPLPTGGDVKSAVLVSKVAPVYPPLAKNQHISGNVIVDALIDASGRVSTMKVISGPALLQQSAMDALRQWKYQPAMLDGKAVPMHLTVTLQFREQ